jgi:holin-like protein
MIFPDTSLRHPATDPRSKPLRGALQVLFFIAAWWASEQALRWLHWSLPAAVPALFVVLALLAAGVLPEQRLAAGANWLLGDMLLFFIPPLLAVVRFGPLLAHSGLRLLGAIALGSLLVLVGTGLVVERTLRWERARQERRQARETAR